MPLGLSDNLFQRIVSALTLLPVVLGLIYLGGWWFFALLGLGGVLMVREWCILTNASGGYPYYLALIVALLPAVVITANITPFDASLLSGALLAAGIVLLVVSPSKLATSTSELPRPVNGIVGGIYVTLAITSMAWLRLQDADGRLVIWLFFAVWAMDVGGYFAGKGIGGPKLAPTISPKKTWAGLIGGVLLSSLVSLAFALLLNIGSPLLLPIAGAALAIVAQLGDLYESAVKRALNTKDSGALIPGHGGILDRVDGLVFAAPVMVFAFAILEMSGGAG